MSEHCIIRADFSNWRPIQGRKVMQLIFEVPIEEAEAALKMLGIPQPGASTWCAIALLENGKPAGERSAGSQKQMPKPSENSAVAGNPTGHELKHTNVNTAETGTSETHRKFADLPLSQQAAIRCGDAMFQEYLKRDNADAAADEVRLYCEVESRSEINLRADSGARWLQLEAKYQAWLTDRKYAQVAR